MGLAFQSGLNVSTVRGKESKLLYRTNFELSEHDPPFPKPSFVKLDSLVSISFEGAKAMRILSGGRVLNDNDLLNIQKLIGIGT
jgi:hypothetical protein